MYFFAIFRRLPVLSLSKTPRGISKHYMLISMKKVLPGVIRVHRFNQRLLKYLVLLSFHFLRYLSRKSTKYHPIEIPPKRHNVPIQPGIFKGEYSVHGIELIMVTYNDDNTKMDAIKITVRSFFSESVICIQDLD